MEPASEGKALIAGRSAAGHKQDWHLFEHVPDSVLLVGLRGQIVFANTQAEQLFGYTRERLVGMPVHDLVPERFRKRHIEHFHTFCAAPAVRPLGSGLELHALHRDGHELLVDINLRSFDTDDGMVVAASVRDLSERRRLLEAIRDSAHFNLAILASLQDHVAVLDRDGMILAVNDAWAQFGHENGAEASDRIGPNVSYLDACRCAATQGDDTASRALSGVQSVLDRSAPEFVIEYPCDSSTERRWFQMAVLPLVRDDGGAVVSHTDITNRRKAEIKRNEALAEIEQLKEQLRAENLYLREEIKSRYNFEEIVGKSEVLTTMLRGIEQVANTDSNVLIMGETGTGKELVARAIHENSSRKDRPLVKVNCAALSPSLLESELFGHTKGSFTGAMADRTGRFKLADGGSLFLDEIGELPLELQSKLLHVLQEGRFEPLGSDTTMTVDVRVIAATNRDLRRALDEKTFRPDLYYRLAVFPIEVPPLRQRRDDIPLLAWHFVTKHSARLGAAIKTIPSEAMQSLTAYDWPGNVRELENVVERAMILSRGPQLDVTDLLDKPRLRRDAPQAASSIQSVERAHLVKVLKECQWKVKGTGNAAEQLGLQPGTLRYRMKRLGIERPEN